MNDTDSALTPSFGHSNENDSPPSPVPSSNANPPRFPPRRSSLSPVMDHLNTSGDFFSTTTAQKSSSGLIQDKILEEDEKYDYESPSEDELVPDTSNNDFGLGLRDVDIREPQSEDVEVTAPAMSETRKEANGAAQNPSITIDFDFEDLAIDTNVQDPDAAYEKQKKSMSSDSIDRSPTVGSDTTLVASPKASMDITSTSRPKSSQGKFASKLRRRSWMPGSRSPSPKKTDGSRVSNSQVDEEETDEPLTMASGRRERMSTVISSSRPTSSQRNSSFSNKFTQRLRKRPSGISNLDAVPDDSPTKSSESLFTRLQKSASEDKLSVPALIPSTRSSDRLSSYVQSDVLAFTLTTKSRQARKRDELWSVFRDLETGCQRFISKHLDQKSAVLRDVLQKFLNDYQSHPSNRRLHPEDLDRRASILYKWWNTLLEFLKSRTFPMAANGTRTAVLEAVIGLMERPEWRHFPSPFCPALARTHSDAISESTSSNSDNDYLVESVQHNVRMLFSHCLQSQLAFAVEKMSARAIPSLVAFCGKTCAYAFFFCPGVAATLVQLWRPPMDVMKRVLEENGLTGSSKMTEHIDRVFSAIPPTLKDVQFPSLSAAFRFLRNPAPTPAGTENVNWKGAWVDRWSGQDTDLFYSFVRQYYILLYDYIPEASKAEKVSAAGGLFIQAQILVNMEATIKRHISRPIDPPPIPSLANPDRLAGFVPTESSLPPDENRKPASITFDDVLADPDSSAAPVSFVPTNADRVMAENRLIMLLRDVLITYARETPPNVREALAQTFADLMRATAKTTPQFNRFASDALCDFVEEAVVIFIRYEQTNSSTSSFMDWSFWFNVWKRMASSNNYFTEMKVYSVLYTIWPAIALQPKRKTELCLSFLLEKNHFESRFSHWSPMVRAYYMRLLAWRVARCNEDVSAEDLKLLELLADRLMGIYGNYLYLREHGKGPNTSPSNPAPSRRFIIVRADHTQSTRSGPVISFDAPSAPHNAAYKRSLMLDQLCSPDLTPEERPTTAMSFASSNTSEGDQAMDDSPKKWTGGLLRSFRGTSKTTAFSSPNPGRQFGTRVASAPILRPSSKQSTMEEQAGIAAKPVQISFPAYRTYCFRFSLELVDRRMGSPASMQLQVPRLPQPAQLLLTRHLRGLSLTGDSEEDNETPAGSSADDASANTADDAIDINSLQSTSGGVASSLDEETPALINPRASWANKMTEPRGEAKMAAPYCGRALAEWTVLVSECHMFFERRKAEGVPGNRWVETPLLGTEVLRRNPL